MGDEVKYAIYSLDRGWLIDTCAGGTWSWSVKAAVWYNTILECDQSLRRVEAGAGIRIYDYCFLRVQ